MAETPACLPYLFPYIRELRQSRKAAEKILEFYQMTMGYLASTQGAKVGQVERAKEEIMERGISESRYRYFWELVFGNLCTSCL